MYHLDTTGQPFQCHLLTIHHTPIQCSSPLKMRIRHFPILPHILSSMYMAPRLKRPRRPCITIVLFLPRFPMLPVSFPPRLSRNLLQKAIHPHRVPFPFGPPSSHRNLFLDSSPPMPKPNSNPSLLRVFKSTTAHWKWVSRPSLSSSGSIHIDGTPWTTYSCRASARGLFRKQHFVHLS